MKANKLREMSSAELEEELLSLRKVQFGLRIQHATQQIENVSQINILRKDIARVKTILRERISES